MMAQVTGDWWIVHAIAALPALAESKLAFTSGPARSHRSGPLQLYVNPRRDMSWREHSLTKTSTR